MTMLLIDGTGQIGAAVAPRRATGAAVASVWARTWIESSRMRRDLWTQAKIVAP